MIETLAHEYSCESTQWELSNKYQYDRVLMVCKKLCVFVLWTKVASALIGSGKMLVANLANTKWCKKNWKMIETLAWVLIWEDSVSYLMNTNMTVFKWLLNIFASMFFGQK